MGTKPWQLQQASDAIRIYRYQYRGAKAGEGDSPTAQAFVDDAARLERLRDMHLKGSQAVRLALTGQRLRNVVN